MRPDTTDRQVASSPFNISTEPDRRDSFPVFGSAPPPARQAAEKVSAACSLSLYLPPARGEERGRKPSFMQGASPIGQPVGLRTRFVAPC